MVQHIRYKHEGKKTPFDLLPHKERMKIKAANKMRKEMRLQGLDVPEAMLDHQYYVVRSEKTISLARSSDGSNEAVKLDSGCNQNQTCDDATNAKEI